MNNQADSEGPALSAKPKIVLLFPQPLEESGYSLEIPLSILAVAAPLHADGYQVILIDERLHDDPERYLLEAAEGALCVGISTITGYQLKRAIDFSRLVKKRLPQVPIIWGGYHPSLMPEQCAAEPYVDAVVRGQGEQTVREIVARLEAGLGFQGLAGVTFQNQDGAIISGPNRPFENINHFPPAPYELLDIERFFEKNGGRRALQFITSQGCPFKCNFCVEPTVFGKWSGRSAEKVATEVAALKQRYGITHVTFSDPNFFASKNRVKVLCQKLIERDVRITWSAAARADQLVTISQELSGLLASSGCSQIGIGMESGSQAILDFIDKQISPEEAIGSNQILEEVGIQGVYAFMVGFPKELPEADDEIRQTLSLIKKMRRTHPGVVTVTFYVTPYPGTPIYDIAKRLNLEMPQATGEWARWDSTKASTTWITPEEKDLVERCNNFYFAFAYPNRQLRRNLRRPLLAPVLYPLHWLAALRCLTDFYRFPFEWRLMQKLAGAKRFRRASSQIDALRGY